MTNTTTNEILDSRHAEFTKYAAWYQYFNDDGRRTVGVEVTYAHHWFEKRLSGNRDPNYRTTSPAGRVRPGAVRWRRDGRYSSPRAAFHP